MELDDEVIGTMKLALSGASPYIYFGIIAIIWTTTYAVISLSIGYPLHAIWSGLAISIFGLFALISIAIDYAEFRFKLNPNILHQYLRRLVFVVMISILMVLSIWGIVPPAYFLMPLDIFTNNIFFVLILPPLTKAALDILTMPQRKTAFNHLESGTLGGFERRLEYIILTLIAAVLLFVAVEVSVSLYHVQVSNLIVLMAIIILSILLYIITSLSQSLKTKTHAELQLFLYIGAFLLMLFFIHRAWSFYHGEEVPIMEELAIVMIVSTAIIHSARKLGGMKFATPGTVSKYLFGLFALGVGGVVIAILFQGATHIGEFTEKTAMFNLYIAHFIAIASAIGINLSRKIYVHISNPG